jgi:hypothetical protein
MSMIGSDNLAASFEPERGQIVTVAPPEGTSSNVIVSLSWTTLLLPRKVIDRPGCRSATP